MSLLLLLVRGHLPLLHLLLPLLAPCITSGPPSGRIFKSLAPLRRREQPLLCGLLLLHLADSFR